MKLIAPLQIKNLTSEDGERTFSGYGSTFGNKDRVADIVQPGAFAKSLEEHREAGTMPALLLHHDLQRPIGVWTKMNEDSHGLAVEGRLTAGVRDADEAYNLLKDGALHSLSIGYRVVNEEYDRKTGTTFLNEVKVHEVSLVTIPANAAAVVASVKDAEGNPDIRELERVLRDAGLSRREAKALLSAGYKALQVDVLDEEVAAETAEQQKRLDALYNKLNGGQ